MCVESPLTIPGLLRSQAERQAAAVALRSANGATTSYGELADQVEREAKKLSAIGVAPHQAVLVKAPNTVGSVVALLAAMSVAIAIPIDPDSRDAELERFGTLAAAIYDPNVGRWIVRSAPLTHEPDEALHTPQPSDIAVMLPTSGTSSAPRMVMLTHEQWLAGAARVVGHYGLTAGDRSVNLMPLHHNHGLNGCVAASIIAGAQVMCPGPIDFAQLGTWLAEIRPTWLTAAPTVHRALLDLIRSDPEVLANSCLRFLRSTSAPLPNDLRAELSTLLDIPVVQAWALTEAAGQVTAESIPPSPPWGVGTSRHGFDVRVIDADGAPCSPGVPGEIVIRGGQLSAGYFDDELANRTTFRDDGLHTRDIGALDADGRLTILGRDTDHVNSGGNTIWLPTIDEALRAHPAIDEALAFAVPHPRLGEDIAVAVTLRAGSQIAPASLSN